MFPNFIPTPLRIISLTITFLIILVPIARIIYQFYKSKKKNILKASQIRYSFIISLGIIVTQTASFIHQFHNYAIEDDNVSLKFNAVETRYSFFRDNNNQFLTIFVTFSLWGTFCLIILMGLDRYSRLDLTLKYSVKYYIAVSVKIFSVFLGISFFIFELFEVTFLAYVSEDSGTLEMQIMRTKMYPIYIVFNVTLTGWYTALDFCLCIKMVKTVINERKLANPFLKKKLILVFIIISLMDVAALVMYSSQTSKALNHISISVANIHFLFSTILLELISSFLIKKNKKIKTVTQLSSVAFTETEQNAV
ncbi:hypothetical protein HK099_007785 [Clydaea vesicula]|uniref:Uncharacterized protein n=1 Tax=Clydaea vesicula TaxID=447962 RepID=A0AAD5U9A6_9FUNG|nr:hypothetical protein HK099_007785 [Clydaea vesicula]